MNSAAKTKESAKVHPVRKRKAGRATRSRTLQKRTAAIGTIQRWIAEDQSLPQDTWPRVEQILKQNGLAIRKR